MKVQAKVFLSGDLARALDERARRTRRSKSEITQAALATFLSPDSGEAAEAALVRRLDRISRELERLDRDVTISNEALALFVRFWLTANPPLPESAMAAAQAAARVFRDCGLPGCDRSSASPPAFL